MVMSTLSKVGNVEAVDSGHGIIKLITDEIQSPGQDRVNAGDADGVPRYQPTTARRDSAWRHSRVRSCRVDRCRHDRQPSKGELKTL